MKEKSWLTPLGLLLGLLFLSGCANPCEDFAERVCERSGSHSEKCLKVLEQAATATTAERNQCGKALKMSDTLSKNR